MLYHRPTHHLVVELVLQLISQTFDTTYEVVGTLW